jgi:hypothetical protein
MSFTHRLNLILLIIVLLNITHPAWAKTGADRQVEFATSLDGSAIRITTITNEATETRQVQVQYRRVAHQPMQLIWQNVFSLNESLGIGSTSIEDWNNDGINDVSIAVNCGAGPDCETKLYRIDTVTRQMVEVGTTYGITRVISDYLIDMGRNNCCSWIGNAHRLSADRQRFNPTADFLVYVAADEASAKHKPARCYFYKQTSSGEKVIPAPNQALKQICDWYK